MKSFKIIVRDNKLSQSLLYFFSSRRIDVGDWGDFMRIAFPLEKGEDSFQIRGFYGSFKERCEQNAIIDGDMHVDFSKLGEISIKMHMRLKSQDVQKIFDHFAFNYDTEVIETSYHSGA